MALLFITFNWSVMVLVKVSVTISCFQKTLKLWHPPPIFCGTLQDARLLLPFGRPLLLTGHQLSIPQPFSQRAPWFHLHRARVSAICPPYWWWGLKTHRTKQNLSLFTSQYEACAGTQQAASTSTSSQQSAKAKTSKRSSHFWERI